MTKGRFVSFGTPALALLTMGPLGTILSRNAAYPILIIATGLFLIAAIQAGLLERRKASLLLDISLRNDNFVTFALCVVAVLYAALSLLWSPTPERGSGALLQIVVACMATASSIFVAVRLRAEYVWQSHAFASFLVMACIIGLIELRFGSPLRTYLGGSGEAYRLNRSAVAVALFVPLLLLLARTPFVNAVKVIATTLAVVFVFSSASETAKLVFIVIFCTFSLSFVLSPKKLLQLCCFGVVLSHLLAPMVGWALYTFVPESAFRAIGYASQHSRAIIWWAYSSETWDSLILGHGLQASYAAGPAYSGSDAVMASGLLYIHPHNASIQIWYELGLAGAVFSTALIVLSFRPLFFLSDRSMVVASALVLGVWSVAFVSHGAWQHWWWALVGIVTILFVVLARLDNEERAAETI